MTQMNSPAPQFRASRRSDSSEGSKAKESVSEDSGKRLPDRSWRWVVLALLGAAMLFLVVPQAIEDSQYTDIPYGQLVERVQSDRNDVQVKSVSIDNATGRITGVLRNGEEIRTNGPAPPSEDQTRLLQENGVEIEFEPPNQGSLLGYILPFLFPILIVVGFYLLLRRQAQGQMNGITSIGRSKAKVYTTERPKTTFDDVAGYKAAKTEINEVVDFLKDPEKFTTIGARIPKGVLLVGPPGTGKTLLARAVAGEAGVPFMSVTGSDFMEMFVGVGASRVRDLFQTARKQAPAIVFIDEIDSIGRKRGAGLGGGHDEREQTLNQMLSEMDGFESSEGVVMMAATNRPDILDPALLRPGRFDRQITVDRPDIEGRKAILRVHAAGKPLHEDVDLDVIARRTPGFTGADIANLLNEAALITARHNGKVISMVEIEDAIDRVIGGPERKSRVMSDEEKRVIAFHEGGHALVGHLLPDANPVHKVSIIARGRALGWTLSLPEADRNIATRKQMKAELAVLLGGRVAEEVVFEEPSTGASNDIEKVSEIARNMVTQYGMSDELGPQQLGQRDGEVFLGRQVSQANYSGELAAKIDSEIRVLVDEAHSTATQIITTHRETLDRLAETLIEKETVDSTDLKKVWGHLPTWGTGLRSTGSNGANGKGAVRAGRSRAASGPSTVDKPAPRKRTAKTGPQPSSPVSTSVEPLSSDSPTAENETSPPQG